MILQYQLGSSVGADPFVDEDPVFASATASSASAEEFTATSFTSSRPSQRRSWRAATGDGHARCGEKQAYYSAPLHAQVELINRSSNKTSQR